MKEAKGTALAEIRFHQPQSLPEAMKLLQQLEHSRVLAGGTDILVDLKQGLARAENLISLQKIKELSRIEKKAGNIIIGAMTTAHEIASSALLRQYFPALQEAAQSMASYQIRTMATIGGNIASAVPSADLPPPLIAAGALVELQSLNSSRSVQLSDFFSGPRQTVLQPGEVLTFIKVPLSPLGSGISFQKFSRREANALAVASVAARLAIEDGTISKAIIVLGAVAPTPVIAAKASEFLTLKKPSEAVFQEAASLAKEESQPISDVRGSIWFRKELVEVLTKKALNEALKRAQARLKKGN